MLYHSTSVITSSIAFLNFVFNFVSKELVREKMSSNVSALSGAAFSTQISSKGQQQGNSLVVYGIHFRLPLPVGRVTTSWITTNNRDAHKSSSNEIIDHLSKAFSNAATALGATALGATDSQLTEYNWQVSTFPHLDHVSSIKVDGMKVYE